MFRGPPHLLYLQCHWNPFSPRCLLQSNPCVADIPRKAVNSTVSVDIFQSKLIMLKGWPSQCICIFSVSSTPLPLDNVNFYPPNNGKLHNVVSIGMDMGSNKHSSVGARVHHDQGFCSVQLAIQVHHSLNPAIGFPLSLILDAIPQWSDVIIDSWKALLLSIDWKSHFK